jgi:hypothetical protein
MPGPTATIAISEVVRAPNAKELSAETDGNANHD